jgi:EpsI family protein
VFRKIAFACLYLVFLVPTGQYLIPALQDITAKFVEVGLNALSIPFYREGTVFDLVNGRYEIAEACAGLRFLVATVALGVLYAHLTFRKARKIAIFLAACFVVPVAGNGIRALVTVMVANYTNNRVAVGFDHIVYGWVFAVAIIMLLLYVGSKYADPEPQQQAAPAPAGKSARPRALAGALGGTAVTLGLLLAISQYAAADTGAVDAAALDAALAGPGWTQTTPSADWHVTFSTASGAITRSLVAAGNGAPVDVDIHYYDRGARSSSMLASLNFAWQEDTWHAVAQQILQEHSGELTLPVKENTIVAGNDRRLVWTSYWIDGAFTTSSPLVRLLEFRAGVMHGHSAILVLSTPIDGTETEARARLRAFLNSRANLAAGLVRAGASAS